MKLNYVRNPQGISTQEVENLKNRIDTIEPKVNSIDNIKDRLDILEPKVTNLGNITAKTNIKNTFLTPQTIRGTTAFVEFKKTDNDRKGWIGKGSDTSDDISVTAETNSLILNANNHILVRPGNNYQFLYERSTLSNENEVVNKKYVDKFNNYIKVINHSANLTANQVNQWTLSGLTLENKGVYEVIIKTGVSGKDLLASGIIMVNDKNYLNQFSTFTWSDNWEGNPDKKLVLAIHENKIKMQSNFIMGGVVVFVRKLNVTTNW